MIKPLTLLASILLTACSVTQVDESWTLPGYKPPAAKKVMVIALASQATTRELVEQEFVKQLAALGISADASSRWLPGDAPVTRKTVRPIVEQEGFTLVLVNSLTGVEKNQIYQPADALGPNDSLYRTIDDTYYTFTSTGEHISGTYVETLEYLLESNLYDVASEKLSWSVHTRTLEPATLKKGAESVVKTVLNQAREDNIF